MIKIEMKSGKETEFKQKLTVENGCANGTVNVFFFKPSCMS